MENFQQLISEAPRHFHKFSLTLEQTFLDWTQNVDFAFFCIIYTVLLVVFLKYLTKTQKFRPKNKELISNSSFIFRLEKVREIGDDGPDFHFTNHQDKSGK